MEALDRVLADKPSTRPRLLVDTLGEGVQVGDDSTNDEEDNESDHVQTDGSLDDLESVSAASADKSSSGLGSTAGCVPSAKESKIGKKRGREERLEKIMGGIVDKILTSQAESDRKFLELEEKRTCSEERERERRENKKGRKEIPT